MTAEPGANGVTPQDLADVLMVVVLETVAALRPDSKRADQALEDIAGRLLDFGGRMPAGNARFAISALAKNLIQTETGAQEQ